MSTVTRIAGFVGVLAASAAIGLGAGAAFGPPALEQQTEAPAPMGQGVVTTRDGYHLVPLTSTLPPRGGAFRFQVLDAEGRPATGFTPVHERELHLVVVNRELTSYQHVHPTLDGGGTWTVDLDPLAPGSYRAIADFQITDGPRLALGTDLAVAGSYIPTQLPAPRTTAHVDGYDVALAAEVGRGGEVTASLTVTRDGAPVTDLEPYLGANGHLVAIRAGDLAYAHVHPVDDDEHGVDGETVPPADGTVTFDAALDAAGRYGLFFDFRHGGRVHTARFTFDQGVVDGDAEMEHAS